MQLKIAIIRSGKSQRELAADASIPESRLSSIVCGWVSPRSDERAAIKRCLGVGDEVFPSAPALETRSRR